MSHLSMRPLHIYKRSRKTLDDDGGALDAKSLLITRAHDLCCLLSAA